MASRLEEIFDDAQTVEKIERKLPYLFQLAEMESSRAGKVGMEAGSLREKILVALLIYKFGEDNVQTEIPPTEPEVDVKLFGKPISIKTVTGKSIGGVKLVWTVDPQKARKFKEEYCPKCDFLLVHINWGGRGGFYYIPVEVQQEVFEKLGKEVYIKLPKPGTNPRGVEISKEAISALIADKRTKCITIEWRKTKMAYNPYKRWVDCWKEE